MTMVIMGGDQHKAERIARDIIKDLTISDIDFTVAEGMGRKGELRLCSAVDSDFLANEQRHYVLAHKIREAAKDDLGKLFSEYEDLSISTSIARQKANFLLGYMAARRLLDIDETMKNRGRSMPLRAKKKRAGRAAK